MGNVSDGECEAEACQFGCRVELFWALVGDIDWEGSEET